MPNADDRISKVYVKQPDKPHAVLSSQSSTCNVDQFFVSCVMPTRNRFEQARIAIDCFINQAHPLIELIIVDSSDSDELSHYIHRLDDDRIIFIPDIGNRTPVGVQRNRAIERSNGTHICVWDDDDLHHAHRVRDQLRAMSATNCSAALMFRETLWIVDGSRLSITSYGNHPNSLLCAKTIAPVYPDDLRGSDIVAVEDGLLKEHSVALLDAPHLYVRIAHGNNLWDRHHFESEWNVATKRYSRREAIDHLLSLTKHLPVARNYDLYYGKHAWMKAVSRRDPVRRGD